MAIIKVKGVKEVSKALNRSIRIELNKIFRDKDLRLRIGTIVVDDIKKNVDMGTAAAATIDIRKYLEQYNQTDSAYKRSKIKAVFGGHLLKDLENNVKGFPTRLTFEIEHSNKKHPGYNTKSSRTKRSTFKKISEYLLDMGYDYFQLSSAAKKKIVKQIQIEFTAKLKNN